MVPIRPAEETDGPALAAIEVAEVDGRAAGSAMLRRAGRSAAHRHVLELAGPDVGASAP